MSTMPIALPDVVGHGDHIRPEYRHGAWGQSTDDERQEGGLTGTVKRFKTNQKASDKPQAYGWIKSTYAEAIEYSGMKRQGEGLIMVGAFFGLMTLSGGFWLGLFFLFGFGGDLFQIALSVFVFGMAFLVFTWAIVLPIRRIYRAPHDLPILFDRQHRKVYRILQDVQPGLKGLYQPWPVRAVAYDWDLIDAEHDVRTTASAATVSQTHRLVFVVRKSANDPTIIDHFEIGNGMTQTDTMIAPMWEHIRRFMEENGPHLPHPTEPLDSRLEEKPTWWQACGEAGPFGSRYGWWWKNHPIMTAFYHVFPGASLVLMVMMGIASGGHPVSLLGLLGPWIVVSINWGQGTGIWLIAHTSRDYDWPQAVKDAVGPATARGAGW